MGLLFGVALVCGIVLTITSIFFAVKEDEKAAEIRECLPGANCGACGYTGCDGYAKALSEGTVEATNLCVPGGDKVARDIADILGVEAGAVVEQVAFVACNGVCGAVERKYSYVGPKSCIAANLSYNGDKFCTAACLGYGDCMSSCPNDAICVSDGVARIDTSKCTGCGQCARACPKHLIILVPDVRRTIVRCSNKEKGAIARKKCSNSCIACKKCEKACKHDAIHVIDNVAQIDFVKCIDCGECSAACPMGIISQQDLSGEHRYTGQADET